MTTRPDAQLQIAHGIHRLRVPIPDNPLGYLNAYVLKTESGCLLVDAGWNGEFSFAAFAQQLEQANVTWSDLRYIVLTHAHQDNFGLVGRVLEHAQA